MLEAEAAVYLVSNAHRFDGRIQKGRGQLASLRERGLSESKVAAIRLRGIAVDGAIAILAHHELIAGHLEDQGLDNGRVNLHGVEDFVLDASVFLK